MRKKIISILLALTFAFPFAPAAQNQTPTFDKRKQDLIFPGLLKTEELNAGNPLATYAAMLELENEYLKSKIFAGIYPEIRFNFEEFLGFPLAGLQAMQLPVYRIANSAKATPIPKNYQPEKALDVIEKEARKTRIVIWAEEHHLPQTRSLYEGLLKKLWNHGYRYLAAETFTEIVMKPEFKTPDYKSGYYLKDPIFASAVRLALRMGYKLVAYDTNEQGAPGDASFRDRKQASNLKERIFDRDPQAKVLILAGRGHASEEAASDGWTPMAHLLKKTTGIDPFTIWSPTMTQRQAPEEEHPFYRFAASQKLIKQPVIFADESQNAYLKPETLDAFVFFPRFNIVQGRPDWMEKELKRKKVRLPKDFINLLGNEWRLIQAFERTDPNNAIPADQFLVKQGDLKVLMLPAGKYRLRAIDKNSNVLKQTEIKVK